jgi:hypothetical protein
MKCSCDQCKENERKDREWIAAEAKRKAAQLPVNDNTREMALAMKEIWDLHKRIEDRLMRLSARIEEAAGLQLDTIRYSDTLSLEKVLK